MLNLSILQGRLTDNPELRTTPSGTSVCSVSIACERDFKSDEGERETDFITVVSWRHNAEFLAKYFKKGQQLVVSGRLQTRTYTDKNDVKRKAVEIVAEHFYFCGGKTEGANSQNQTGAEFTASAFDNTNGSADMFMEVEESDDLPF